MENPGALLLTAAICHHHFTAMVAKIILDPAIELSGDGIRPGLLAIAVAFASFVIVVLALGGVAIDMRARRRELRPRLMRDAANATFEGLLVCEGATIVTVNDHFAALIGCSGHTSLSAKLSNILPTRTSAGRSSIIRTSLSRAPSFASMARKYQSNLSSGPSISVASHAHFCCGS